MFSQFSNFKPLHSYFSNPVNCALVPFHWLPNTFKDLQVERETQQVYLIFMDRMRTQIVRVKGMADHYSDPGLEFFYPHSVDATWNELVTDSQMLFITFVFSHFILPCCISSNLFIQFLLNSFLSYLENKIDIF